MKLKLKLFLLLFCFPFLLTAEEDDSAFVDHPLNRLDIERRLVSLPPVRSPLNLTYLTDPLNEQIVQPAELTASQETPSSESSPL